VAMRARLPIRAFCDVRHLCSTWGLAVRQVAAHAEHHIIVRKAIADDGRMLTRIQTLAEEDERAHEVADMLGACSFLRCSVARRGCRLPVLGGCALGAHAALSSYDAGFHAAWSHPAVYVE
jgi:hypothetical protein